MKFIQGIIATIRRRRSARQMRISQHRAWALELNRAQYELIHTCLKNLVQAIELGDIDDLRRRRSMLRASNDVLMQVHTPERPADQPNPIF